MLRVTPLGAGQHVGGKLSWSWEGKDSRKLLNLVQPCSTSRFHAAKVEAVFCSKPLANCSDALEV